MNEAEAPVLARQFLFPPGRWTCCLGPAACSLLESELQTAIADGFVSHQSCVFCCK